MKHILNLFWITVVALFFFFVVISIEERVLAQRVVPTAGVTLPRWLSNFGGWASIGILAAWIGSICWYVMAQWVFRINNLSDAGKRGVWFLLTLIPLAGIIPAFIFPIRPQIGIELTMVFFLVNPLLCYYIATVFFSPPAHKYVPLLASALRRW